MCCTAAIGQFFKKNLFLFDKILTSTAFSWPPFELGHQNTSERIISFLHCGEEGMGMNLDKNFQ